MKRITLLALLMLLVHVRAQESPPLGQTSTYAPLGITEFSFERTTCERNCRAYKIIIQPNGRFIYTGINAVEKLGTHTGHVSTGTLKHIFDYLEEIAFFKLTESNTIDYSSNPVTITRVVRGGVSKEVVNPVNGGSARLWALGQLVDALVAAAVWDE